MLGRTLVILTAILLISSVSAFGAELSYEPESILVEGGAGTVESVPLTVTLNNPIGSTYFLWFVDRVEGNIPAGWISASPSMKFLSRWRPSATTTLTVRVPPDATPGDYSAIVYSKAMASHGPADPGSGVLVEISMTSACSGVPVFTIESFGPEVIWPPNHSMETVGVTGTVSLPEGCSLLEVGYSVEDEYGIYTSVGELTVDQDGAFTLYVPVEAWRYGQDKDGRHYVITLLAEDEAGQATETLNAVVPHDMRDKRR